MFCQWGQQLPWCHTSFVSFWLEDLEQKLHMCLELLFKRKMSFVMILSHLSVCQFPHLPKLFSVRSTKEKTTKDDIVVEMKTNTKNEEAVLLKAVNGDKKGPSEQVTIVLDVIISQYNKKRARSLLDSQFSPHTITGLFCLSLDSLFSGSCTRKTQKVLIHRCSHITLHLSVQHRSCFKWGYVMYLRVIAAAFL